MNRNTNNEVHPSRLAQAALWVLAATCGLLVLLPATSSAATAKFGADLSGPVTPVAAPEPCAAVPGAGCTRVATYYDDPSHAGGVPFAPKDGTIKKISLVAANPGALKIQLAKVKGTQAKIRTDGPKLKYLGTGSVETFKVHIPVRKGQWLAFKGKYADTLSCGAGFDTEVQFQPALPVGGPLTTASGASDCTHLIGARMKY